MRQAAPILPLLLPILPLLLPILPLLASGGCGTGIVTVGNDGGRDGQIRRDGALRDALSDSLPGPGDPCPFGQCTDDALCIGGICLQKCTQPQPGCNDKASECSPNQTCGNATSFSDACYPASADTGQPCGNGALCKPGNVCVKPDSNPAHCVKLCKYGCPPGVACITTEKDCEVCLE